MPKIVFHAGQNNEAAFLQLEQELETKVAQYVNRAFDRYSEGQDQIDSVLRRLLSRKNLEMALFPKTPLTQNDISKLGKQTKNVAFSLEEVTDAGVVTTFQKIDQADIGLYAGIFVLPDSPRKVRSIVNNQAHYKYFRPHVEDSKMCLLSDGKEAYFTNLIALGFSVGSVLYSEELSDGSHFHLRPNCTGRDGERLETSGIVENMDGLKIYFPIAMEENGTETEKTVTVSANITVWGGLSGLLMKAVPSQKKRDTYSMAGFSEILMVLTAQSNETVITYQSQTQHPTSE